MFRKYHVTMSTGGCMIMTVEESWWVQQKPEWWEAGDKSGPLVRIRGRCYKVGVKVETIDREEADCEPCG